MALTLVVSKRPVFLPLVLLTTYLDCCAAARLLVLLLLLLLALVILLLLFTVHLQGCLPECGGVTG